MVVREQPSRYRPRTPRSPRRNAEPPRVREDRARRAHERRAAVHPARLVPLFDDGEIVFRTGAGTKLRAAESGDVLAFEVDAYDAGPATAGA